MVTPADGSSHMLNDYQLHLPQFEGPLDVLLRLIERSQLAVTDLSLVRVTEQFLDHVRELDGQTPPQVIAEFTAVGARLTLLKSRSLLPRPPVEEIEDDPSDLTRQLEEYRCFKEIASGLSARLAEGTGCFGPESGRMKWHDSRPVRLALYEPTVLIRSIRRRLSTIPPPASLLKQRPIVTLPQMVERIVSFLHATPGVSFRTVLVTCRSRSEAATAFLAMLVLHRRQVVCASQNGLFGDIQIARRADAGAPSVVDEVGAEAEEAFALMTATNDGIFASADD